MFTRTGFMLYAALVLAASGAAHADVYKWVDRNGVTNYSAEPPKDAKAAKKVEMVEEKLSTYTPDAGVASAMKAATRQAEAASDKANADKIDALQRQLDAERRARQDMAEAARLRAQAAYDRCVAERRVDCDAGDQVSHPVLVVRRARPQIPFVPGTPLTGVTAGNVTNAIGAAGAGVNRTPGAFPGTPGTAGSAPMKARGNGR